LGSIWRYPLAGAGVETVVVAVATPHSLVADAVNVYYTDNTNGGAVYYSPASASSQQGMALQTDVGSGATDITSNALDLFWLEPQPGDVRKRSKSMGPDEPSIYSDSLDTLYDITYAHPYLLWKGSSGIARMQVDPLGAPVVLASASDLALRISADLFGSYVYWTTSQTPGEVRRAEIRGSANQPGEVLAAMESHPHEITADASYVYWANRGTNCFAGTGSIRRRSTNIADTTVETIHDGIECASNLVQNDTHVYYGSGLAIYRIAK
jgi:hypothetical protein